MEVLDLKTEELDDILEADVIKGEVLQSEGNAFIGYTADVSSFAEIRKLYLKLRLLHARARHIVCAYYLPGAKHHYQDYEDDGEIGAGRVILSFMQRNNLMNRVFFVTRFCGAKLGRRKVQFVHKCSGKSDGHELVQCKTANRSTNCGEGAHEKTTNSEKDCYQQLPREGKKR